MPQINDSFIPHTTDDPSPLLTTSLPLLPFQNQVGGHCSFFRFSKRAICKPMSHKEQEFYEYLEQHHAPILPFTSQYLGVVNVTYRSFNAQPMLPEVVLAENQHLLANWKKYLHSSSSTNQRQSKQQQQQQPQRRPQQRRYSSSHAMDKTRANSYDDRDELSAPSRSPLTFKEQVLREVFSPDALQERLQQVQDWQRGMRQRQLDEASTDDRKSDNDNWTMDHGAKGDDQRDSMKRSILQTSRSVLDFRRQRLMDSPDMMTDGQTPHSHDPNNHTLRLLSATIPITDNEQSLTNNDDRDDLSGDHLDTLQVTVQPRRPSLIDSTTSAPQTPRMRETKLHNPHIRPPVMPIQPSPIPNLTSPSSSPSELSLSPTQMEFNGPTSEAAPSYISSLPAHRQQQQQEQDRTEATSTTGTSASESASWRPRKEPTNPWSVQMYQRDLEKVNVDDTQQFILIEDLTDEIKYPCVLDLKMGTRQHGVYSTTAKMISQTKKCERSTSLRLGVRISGMQVYNAHQGQFLFEDKYKGRTLSPHGFRDSLVRYFDNGHGCHITHLPTLIRKLVLIHRIIQTMDGFRFYASSLLILYDAADTIQQSNKIRRIDVRLIDFAKSVTKHEWISHQHEFTYPPERHQPMEHEKESLGGPDHGYLLGVQSLISCFVWIYVHHGGKKEDLMDLDDALLFGDLPSWLDDDDGSNTTEIEQDPLVFGDM